MYIEKVRFTEKKYNLEHVVLRKITYYKNMNN